MSRRTSRYNRRMYLQSFTTTRTEAKQNVKAWTDEAAFWCNLDFAYKGEEILGGVREGQVPLVASRSEVWIRLRKRTDISFSPTKRIRYGARIFEIVAHYDTIEGRELRLLCREVQS